MLRGQEQSDADLLRAAQRSDSTSRSSQRRERAIVRTGEPREVVMMLALVVAVAALLVVLATPPADAASRYRVVTRTFSSPQPITSPLFGAATPYPSETNAGGFNRGRILDANLTLKNFTHTFPADVDVMLSHGGTNRVVMSDVGGNLPANNITLALDDEAASSMPSGYGSGLTAGTFDPTNVDALDTFPAPAPFPSGAPELSGFDGMNPNGPWRLWVADDFWGEEGGFAGGWSVTIKARVLR